MENTEGEKTLFNAEEMADLVDITEVPEDEFAGVSGQKSDDTGDHDKLKFNTETFTGENLDGNKKPDETKTEGAARPENKSPEPGQPNPNQPNPAPPTGQPAPAASGGFDIDLGMIPGAFMLDAVDGAIRRVEDMAEQMFSVRNYPGLGLTAENKQMLAPIADACMKDAKIRFKTPWHALGWGLFFIVGTNAMLGKWDSTKGKEKKEVKSRSIFAEEMAKKGRKKPRIKTETVEPPAQPRTGRGRPPGTKNGPNAKKTGPKK